MAKPLIATDVPGCRSVVHHGDNGLLCAVRSADALAEAMTAMLAFGAARRAEMGRAGRRLAEQHYDKRIVVDRYLAAVSSTVR
jgi:glycosyltransferase involved in cell wall biosynthesis